MTKRKPNVAEDRAIADVLDGAWDILDTEGWARGEEAIEAIHKTTGPCCLGVAICRSARERRAAPVVGLALQSVARHIGESVPRWNDRQSSPIRVMRVLERVADVHRLRAEGPSK